MQLSKLRATLWQAIVSRQGALSLVVGYFAQAYGAVVAIVFAPFVLNAIGSEAYGLVGVFLILQAWFQLLDAGLTPAVTRESARYQGHAVSPASLVKTVRGLEIVVLISSVPILVLAWMVSDRVAEGWLQPKTLSIKEVSTAIQLMALIVLTRWVSGVRRGLLVGFERHTTLYYVNLLIATLRYPCIVLFFTWTTPNSTNYFLYQFGVSILEALLLWFLCRNLLPDTAKSTWLESVISLRTIARFALNHALLALLWILIAQTDKLLLSRFLSLSHFGYFTLAAAAAYGVNMVLLPIGQFLMPKLSRLKASNDGAAIVTTYRRLTRVAVVSISGITVVFMCFAQQVLMVWTNNIDIAQIGEPVLAWYSLGNAAMALSTFTYYLQYAQGNLKLHTRGTMGFLVVIVPALFFSVKLYGLIGASITWASFWVLYLLTWVTVTHRLLLQRLHWQWLCSDVLVIFIPVLGVGLLSAQWIQLPQTRMSLAFTLFAFWLCFSILAVCLSRLLPLHRWRQFF